MKPYAKYFLFVLLLSNSALINAQNYKKEFDDFKQYHKLQHADSLYDYRFTVIAVPGTKPELKKTYTWYINNTIQITQGNYSGKLLHGTYTKYYCKTNQLAEKGVYKYGLKEGIWQEWNSNGMLRSNILYKKGFKEGVALFYDSLGNVVEKCNFKNDKKHGKCYSYVNGEEQKPVQYKNGVIKEEKARKEKETKEKKPFFAKLKKTTADQETEKPKEKKPLFGILKGKTEHSETDQPKETPKEKKVKQPKEEKQKEPKAKEKGKKAIF